jgi:sortase A
MNSNKPFCCSKKRRPYVVALKYLERTFIGAGCLLLAAYALAQTHAVVGQAQAVDAFRLAQLEAQANSPGATNTETQSVDTSLWAKGRIDAYKESLAVNIDTPEGLLHIPAVDLTVPIFEGTAELNLSRGVGRIDGTSDIGESGNMGIAGHRDGFFRSLKDVKVGDVIEVETLDQVVSYRIENFLIVDPSDIEVLDQTSESILTLVTCYPFYFVGHAPQRYIVQAARVAP